MYKYVDEVDTPGGSFTVSFAEDSTPSIPWNANATELEAALETLPGVGDVAVSLDRSFALSEPGKPTTAMAWLVEFTTLGTPPNAGDIPLLAIDGSFLTGRSVDASVQEVSGGCCTVEVSMNGGADFTSASDTAFGTVAFRYQDKAVVLAVSPSSGPSSGGTEITVVGTGFDLPSAISPDGVFGDTPINHGVLCLFGGEHESPASRLNSTAMVCRTPQTLRMEPRTMSLALRWRGSVSPSLTAAAFTFYGDVSLGSLRPSRGSNSGGYKTTLSIGRGSFASAGVAVTCIFELQLPSNITDDSLTLEFIANAMPIAPSASLKSKGGRKRAQAWISERESYACKVPGIGDFFPRVSRDSWLYTDWGITALVSLSGNGGVDRTPPRIFTYMAKPALSKVEPTFGEHGGKTSAVVHGARFIPPPGGFGEGEILCQLGHAEPVPGVHLSETAVGCVTPPHHNIPAIMSLVIGGGHIFHETQEVLLRIPSPIIGQSLPSSSAPQYLAEDIAISGTWSLELEGFETPAMYSNVTGREMALVLSSLPNVRNATVSSGRTLFVDHRAGVMWNETSFLIYFVGRGGSIPKIRANISNLKLSQAVELFPTMGPSSGEGSDSIIPYLEPQALVNLISGGHNGNGTVCEKQVLRTRRSVLTAEVQTLTLATANPPRAEVSNCLRDCVE